MNGVIAAHATHETIHLLIAREAHEPRETDPHYRHFHEARNRLKAQGLLVCVVCGDKDEIELHHSIVEDSLIPEVDVKRLDTLFGLDIESDAAFQDWAQSVGNLEALCEVHHRGLVGVHFLSEPYWTISRIQRTDIGPVAQVLNADGTPRK